MLSPEIKYFNTTNSLEDKFADLNMNLFPTY